MAAINDGDFSISAGKVIDYTGNAHGVAGAVYHTTIELHRWLQDKADDASAVGNDLMDITYDTPSDRSTDNYIKLTNGYTITDTAIEHIYDGSIEQGTLGAAGSKIWDGQVVIAGEGADLQIMQDGAQIVNDFWNTIPNGETLKGLNRDVANGVSHRFLIKVYDFDADGGFIDGARYIGMTRVDASSNGGTGKTFSEFKVNGSARGNNVIALTYADDLNDTSSAATFSTIGNTTYGYAGINVDGANSFYYSEWNRDTYTINQLYQRIKYLARGESGNSGTLYGIDAKIFRGITHVLTGTQATGNFNASSSAEVATGVGTGGQPEPISWTGGTGQLLAVDSTSAATKIWMQILTGVAPTSGTVTAGITGATFTVSGSSEFAISTPFLGISTGSAIIGATGFGVEALDLGPNDKVFDLDGTQHVAPTNVTFTVSGVVNGEDRILVAPDVNLGVGSAAINYGQFTLNAGVTGATTDVVVKVGTETPGTGTQSEDDTPNSGTIRIQGDDGVYHRVTYTGYTVQASTMTFTGCSGVPTAAINNDVFISYIDSLYGGTSATNTYTATWDNANTRYLFVRVRDGGTAGDAEGIKTFETGASIGNSDSSVSAIRTADV